ncbi:DNA polymerase-3 subunit epsilon [Catalinimonas alkaloidigena]|uniref:DNA polymerase-3 subunit epsilon n=1 Tax=Catalinimonas alkaloidigena TaxID=1075417 RepID=A0A1G9RCX9_9BACT|nr:3'-5' exonuclease [Catalinimonas alkaloidigena]SDM21073.1 DNA polymerase-3 subunit epsilon [Catalinimonas alkaloidigena]
MTDTPHRLKLKRPLAFFDLETTGVDTVKDRIVEISILRAYPNGTHDQKTWRINPGCPIPTETSMIHGIYDEDVQDAPTFKQVAKNIAKYLEGCDLGGFNSIKFDIPMLVEEFLRADVEFDISKRRLVDAQRIFRLMEPRTLTAAYKFYCNADINDLGKGAHSADVDTFATFKVLEAQVERYPGVTVRDVFGNESQPIANDMDVLHDLCTDKMVDLAGRMCFNNDGIEVFNFGKHKNKPVEEVLDKEPAFYDWIMRGDFPLDTKRKLTEIKLRKLKQSFGK